VPEAIEAGYADETVSVYRTDLQAASNSSYCQSGQGASALHKRPEIDGLVGAQVCHVRHG
jgi:hypothetical protein